jgi:hypothetical protein
MTTTIDSELESQLSWLQQEVDQLLLEHERLKDRASWPHAAEIVAVALFLYDRICLWNDHTIDDLAMEDQAQRLFRRWHQAAKKIYSVARDAAAVGYTVSLLNRFRDAIGFCPYIGISVQDIIDAENEYDQGKSIPSEKVHNDIQCRLLQHENALSHYWTQMTELDDITVAYGEFARG